MNNSTQIKKKTFNMCVSKVLLVNATIEIKYRNPPKTCKELIHSLELIKDGGNWYQSDQELIFFFYILSGYTCKHVHHLGGFHLYRGCISGAFEIKFKGISPRFPLTYEYQGEGLGMIPDTLISFSLVAEESLVSPISLWGYIIKGSPSKYRKSNEIKWGIFDNFPLSVKGKDGIFTIRRKT
ncbi:matrix protein [Culex rhabdo-like virus]